MKPREIYKLIKRDYELYKFNDLYFPYTPKSWIDEYQNESWVRRESNIKKNFLKTHKIKMCEKNTYHHSFSFQC